MTTAAARKPLPVSALQVALTARGMKALGVPDAIVASFSPEFVAGMAGDEAAHEAARRRWQQRAIAVALGSRAVDARPARDAVRDGGSLAGHRSGHDRLRCGTTPSNQSPVFAPPIWIETSRSDSRTASASRKWIGNSRG